MIGHMRPLVISFVLAAAFALPLAALSTDAPPPAVVSACQAEAAQLGKDAFVAKYGPTEPFGHCFAAHTAAATSTTTTTTTTTTTADDPAAAACKAEYLKLGADAFKAKYGATEAYGNCLAAQRKPPAPATSDAAKELAKALCAKAKDTRDQCLNALLAKARQIVASCKSSSGSSRDAFKACLAAALATRRR